MMPSKTVSVRLAPETLTKLDTLAEAMQRPRAWLIAHAIERYMDTEAWHRRARQDLCHSGSPTHLHSYVPTTIASLGRTSGNKLKNGRLNYAGWLSLLPDNLLQAFNGFRGKEALDRFSAYSRRDMLNDEHLPLLLKDIGDFLFLKGFFPLFMTHWRFSSP